MLSHSLSSKRFRLHALWLLFLTRQICMVTILYCHHFQSGVHNMPSDLHGHNILCHHLSGVQNMLSEPLNPVQYSSTYPIYNLHTRGWCMHVIISWYCLSSTRVANLRHFLHTHHSYNLNSLYILSSAYVWSSIWKFDELLNWEK